MIIENNKQNSIINWHIPILVNSLQNLYNKKQNINYEKVQVILNKNLDIEIKKIISR